MKAIIISIFVILAGALLVTFISNLQTSDDTLSIADIQSDLTSGAQLIDVRTPEEYTAGYIEQATNLPLANLQAGQFPETAKDKKLYVYCRSGNRSAQASELLKAAGYTNIVDLGGIDDVTKLGGKQVK